MTPKSLYSSGAGSAFPDAHHNSALPLSRMAQVGYSAQALVLISKGCFVIKALYTAASGDRRLGKKIGLNDKMYYGKDWLLGFLANAECQLVRFNPNTTRSRITRALQRFWKKSQFRADNRLTNGKDGLL